jgi:hypothetical protein
MSSVIVHGPVLVIVSPVEPTYPTMVEVVQVTVPEVGMPFVPRTV